MHNFYEISVIIPVYNLEDFIKKTLESVENQIFKNFEAIIINDGSTDSSAEIIDDFALKNSNFKIIHQKNKGLGLTRNVGIENACGRYIAFLDGDDFIEPDYLLKLYEAIEKNNADISCCNFSFYFPNSKINLHWPFSAFPGVYSSEQALKKITSCIGIWTFAWNKLFKRELFDKNKIKFYNMYYEDTSTIPRLFFYAKKVVILSDVLYNYVMRSGSILHTMDAEKINDSIKALGIIRSFYEEKGIYNKLKRRMKWHSRRFEFVVYCNIFMIHFKLVNFKGLFENFKSVEKSLSYFLSEDYSLENSNNPPSMLSEVKEPFKKIKK